MGSRNAKKVKYFKADQKEDLYMTEEFMELEKEFPQFKYIPALSEPTSERQLTGRCCPCLITDVDRHV